MHRCAVFYHMIGLWGQTQCFILRHLPLFAVVVFRHDIFSTKRQAFLSSCVAGGSGCCPLAIPYRKCVVWTTLPLTFRCLYTRAQNPLNCAIGHSSTVETNLRITTLRPGRTADSIPAPCVFETATDRCGIQIGGEICGEGRDGRRGKRPQDNVTLPLCLCVEARDYCPTTDGIM